MERLLGMAILQLDAFDVQGIANTIHVMTVCEWHDHRLLESLLAAVQYKLDTGRPQNLSNILWGSVTMGYTPGREWMSLFYKALCAQITGFNAQDISNTLLAFGRMEFNGMQYKVAAEVVNRLLQQAFGRMTEFSPQQLVNSAWGLARLGFVPSPAWSQQFMASTLSCMHQLKPQELSSLAWSLSRLRMVPDAAWTQEFLLACHRSLPTFSAAQVSQVLLAVGTLRLQPPARWLRDFVARATQMLPALSPQALSNCLFGLSRLPATKHITTLDPTQPDTGSSSDSEGSASGGNNGVDQGASSASISGLEHEAPAPAGHPAWMSPWLDATEGYIRCSSSPGVQAASDSDSSDDSQSPSTGAQQWSAGGSGSQSGASSSVSLGSYMLEREPATGSGAAGPSRPASQTRSQSSEVTSGSSSHAGTGRLSFSMQELCNVVFALGTLGVHPGSRWLDSCLASLQQHISEVVAVPRHVSMLIWGLRQLGVRPPDAWLDSLLEATLPHIPRAFGSMELSTVISALAAWGYMPSERWRARFWWRTLILHSKLRSAPKHTAVLLAALVSLRLAPHMTWSKVCFKALVHSLQSGTCSAEEATSGLRSLVLFGLQPPARWLRAYLLGCYSVWQDLAPEHWSELLWALGKTKAAVPAEWLNRAVAATQPVLKDCNVQQLATILWAFVRLRHRPSQTWVTAFLEASAPKLATMTQRQLVNTIWHLNALGAYPDQHWLESLIAATQQHQFSSHYEQVLACGLARLQLRLSAQEVRASARVTGRRRKVAGVKAAARKRLKNGASSGLGVETVESAVAATASNQEAVAAELVGAASQLVVAAAAGSA